MNENITISIKGSDVVKLAMCACVGWHLGEICIMATCKMLLKLGDKVFEKKEVKENV